MKQRDLILGLGILSAFSMVASSPYQGSVPPTGDEAADFYLYQVETGTWLQNTQRWAPKGDTEEVGNWTTRGELDKNGFDVAVSVVKDEAGVAIGYKLDPKLRGNGSINAHNWYMDTGDGLSVWTFEPVTVDGVSNAYNIVAISGPAADKFEYPRVLAATDEGYLTTDEDGVNTTWQLVTREERIAKMLDGTNKDASWLIPGQDFGRNDNRGNLWTLQFVSHGSGIGHDGCRYNATREAWNNATDFVHYITLTDIPNGTYKFAIRGYYRDGAEDSPEVQQRMIDGTMEMRAQYYAGGAEANVAPITNLKHEDHPNGGRWTDVTGNGDEVVFCVPNGMESCTPLFAAGEGLNGWIETVVTDGKLTVGVVKREGAERDWLIYDDFQLEYVSDATTGANYDALVKKLNDIFEEFSALQKTPGAETTLADAREALASNNGNAMRVAYLKLVSLVCGLREGVKEIAYFNLIQPMAQAEGADLTRPMKEFNEAATRDAFSEALKQLRWARRRAHAERSDLPYKGSEPQAGDFFLYNVGQKQFLCGGSDWGTHAALGFPGVEVTLENPEEEDNGVYYINTHYSNGDSHYMNYRGYMDCAHDTDYWKFVPVEGKENVYHIEQVGNPGTIVAYNIDANTDGDGTRDETTVGTQNKNYSGPAEDAEWMLISRAEREKMLENATLENPVDATFYMQNPSFYRRYPYDEWSFTGTGGNNGWARTGDRIPDILVESWNADDFELLTTVEGLPAGVYRLSANAYYRNGTHESSYYPEDAEENAGQIEFYGQPDTERESHAVLYVDGLSTGTSYLEVPICNILDGAGMAPGEGDDAKAADGTVYNVPNNVEHAHKFFRVGAYKNHLLFELGDGDEPMVGIYKESRKYERDWIVADNFRLLYFGPDTTVDEVESGIEEVTVAPAEAQGDNRVFNLQGIQVTNTAAPGIYIRNGKKFVVK